MFCAAQKVERKPGDRWMMRGPMEYVPPVQVEVVAKSAAIPLDENEGINYYNYCKCLYELCTMMKAFRSHRTSLLNRLSRTDCANFGLLMTMFKYTETCFSR